ncbi:hypothetical protein P3T36_002619 [Kitasatospora sp. MAP12-15]|nr:hypothetical protein [Kitasatospora sp. MAP12-44]
MNHDDLAGEQKETFRGQPPRMETYERPAARTAFHFHHTSGHSPDGEGCGVNDPISRGL